MPTYTTNLALIKPAEGEQALVSQINSNMDVLDSIIGVIQNKMYPVGSIYMSVNATNPGGLLGGTWVAWGSGKVPVGVATGETEFNTVEKTGGAKTHAHTITHTHTIAHTHTTPAHRHVLSDLGQAAINPQGASTFFKRVTASFASNRRFDIPGGTRADQALGQGDGIGLMGYTNTDGNSTTGASSAANSGASSAANSGSSSNLQPYITCYMWKRTA